MPDRGERPMRNLVGALIGMGSLLIAGCGGGGGSSMVETQGIDYEALQREAEQFVPSMGTQGGELILSSVSDPKSFNPITSTETSTSEYTGLMYEGLTQVNGVTSLPEPGLAERWETSEDGLTWTFYLRKGLQWSDGAPLSAYDVEFSFNDLLLSSDIKPNSARDILTIQGKQMTVKALDSLRVQIKLPAPFAPFLRTMNGGVSPVLPKHKYQQMVKKGSFSNGLGVSTPPSEMVVNGPFMLESYLPSQKVVLKRNPHYWKTDKEGNRLPYLERVVFVVVQDLNAALLKFKKGEIDYLAAKGEDFPGLKREEATGGYTVHRLGPATGSSFLFFNQNTGKDTRTGKPYVEPGKLKLFRDEKFRQAVAHALDKNSMIKIVMNGLGYPQWSPMAPSEGYFYTGDVVQYEYDLEKARALLKEIGIEDRNGDGKVEDSAGVPIEFSFVTNSGNNVRVKIAEIIRKDLETLGFTVHFQQLEFNSLIQKIDNPPFAWEACLLALTGGPEPHFGRNVWHSSGTLHMWFPRQKSPSTEWEARIDSLYDIGVKELDPEKRKVIYDEWQRIAAEKLPLIYTVLPERILCINDKFKNINPTLNSSLFHNLEEIYVGQ